jgi:hypothetical protein
MRGGDGATGGCDAISAQNREKVSVLGGMEAYQAVNKRPMSGVQRATVTGNWRLAIDIPAKRAVSSKV